MEVELDDLPSSQLAVPIYRHPHIRWRSCLHAPHPGREEEEQTKTEHNMAVRSLKLLGGGAV